MKVAHGEAAQYRDNMNINKMWMAYIQQFTIIASVQIYSCINAPCTASEKVVSEPDPRKIEKRVWEIGWGGSVHCAQNAGALPINS